MFKKEYKPNIIIRPYKKRKKKKNIIFGVLILCIILGLFIYLGFSLMIKKEIKEIEKIKKENKYLKKKIESISETTYEEILRTKYGFIKSGEKIIIYSQDKKEGGRK